VTAAGDPCDTLLVTGAAGFIGKHLLAHLAGSPNRPKHVIGLDLRGGTSTPDIEWLDCDLTNEASVREALGRVRPDGVVHLAGLTGGKHGLGAYFRANVLACANVLAASTSLDRPPRILVVGSAAMYGVTEGDYVVVDEARPLVGTTPYGVSKILQEKWALLYSQVRSLPVVCVRPFNIMGPGQPESLVPAAFLRQVADVVAGRARDVLCGNLETQRDFLDVRDVAAAMWDLMTSGVDVEGQVFNIASGEPLGIREILDACIALGGRDVPVRQDPARLRKVDVPVIVGDATKLRRTAGWRPSIPWQQSLADMWRDIRPRISPPN